MPIDPLTVYRCAFLPAAEAPQAHRRSDRGASTEEAADRGAWIAFDAPDLAAFAGRRPDDPVRLLVADA